MLPKLNTHHCTSIVFKVQNKQTGGGKIGKEEPFCCMTEDTAT